MCPRPRGWPSDRLFKPENLTALHEMALRRAAQTVDDKLVGQMRAKGIEGSWAAGEHVLVLVGREPFAGALVRAGKRLSDLMMDAPWTVLHLERPNHTPVGCSRRCDRQAFASRI